MVEIPYLYRCGIVPWRPIAKSHFYRIPDDVLGDVKSDRLTYAPSSMTVEAVKKVLVKAAEPAGVMSSDDAAFVKHYLRGRLSRVWSRVDPEVMISSHEEVMADSDLKKSPGFPGYYLYDTKFAEHAAEGVRIESDVNQIIHGKKWWHPCSLALKDEMLPTQKVLDQGTRGIIPMGTRHLFSCKRLFLRQDQAVMANREIVGSTIGIAIPGAGFIKMVLSHYDSCYGGDGKGCDQRFLLEMAKIIRDLRVEFLPFWAAKGARRLYAAVYCGQVIINGVVYQLWHNKSGWFGTAADNTLQYIGLIALAVWRLSGVHPDKCMRLNVNGDDQLFSHLVAVVDGVQLTPEMIGLPAIAKFLEKFNVRIECEYEVPHPPEHCTFLSHTVRWRMVPISGGMQVRVAAGNREKLLASRHWVRRSDTLEWWDCVLAHLLGVRICLWPWRIDFVETDDCVTRLLESTTPTEQTSRLLRARLSEVEILKLHTCLESVSSFTALDEVLKAVLQVREVSAAFKDLLFEC